MLTTPGTPVSSSPGPSSTSTTTTPAGAQHRLMLKQTPIDVWSLREQLGLASAVLRSGDQNWVSVSRQMKPFSEEGRPHDWFSQKNCALQYNLLLEKVDTPRRKRGDKLEATETPGQAIVRRLKAERLKELKQVIEKQSSQIKQFEKEVELLNDPSTPEEKVDLIEKDVEAEDKEEAERERAHEVWLTEREQKKMAIQAALKAHSAKIPLKGAAAAAASAAAQASIRRLSVQSERNSFSDVDSPLSHHHQNQIIENNVSTISKPEQPASTETETTPVESTSPLLSSLLKSPTSLASNLITASNSSIPVLLDIEEKKIEEKMEIDEVPETGETDAVVVPIQLEGKTTAVDENDVVVDNVVEKETNGFMPKPEENVEEPLVLPQVNVETNSTMPDLNTEEETKTEEETTKESDLDLIEDVLVDILDRDKNGTEESSSSVVVVNESNQKEESSSEQQPIYETTVKLEVEEEKENEINSSTTEQTSDNETVQNNDHDVIKVENMAQEAISEVIPAEAENGKDHDDDEIKAEVVDEKIAANNKESDEDKPLTSISETKRTTRMSLSSSTSTPSSKSARRPRKQSDILDDEVGGSEDTPLRRETRSKKNSERSDETSSGLGGLETASEESPLPPPLSGIRETRRSAAKKAQVVLPSATNSSSGEAPVMDDLESSKEEKDESCTTTPTTTTPQSVAENRRVSRLKEKEASGNRKARRGSGATTASRSSSPVHSGDESESDLLTRRRRKSGRTVTSSSATGVTPPPQEASSASNAMDESVSPPASPDVTSTLSSGPVEQATVREPEDGWVKQALNILGDMTSHKSFCKLTVDVNVDNNNVVRRPCSAGSIRKGLEEGSIQNVHEFYTEFMLMLVNIVMSNSSESELYGCAQSLYNEFNDTIQEVLLPLELSKSVPTTPIKSTASAPPLSSSSLPTKSINKNVETPSENNLPKKTRGEKRDASGTAVTATGDEALKRKRGSLSTSLASEESSSTPGTPSNKKRKRN